VDILVVESILFDLKSISTRSITSAFNTDSYEAELSAVFMEGPFVKLASRPIIPYSLVDT